MLRAESNTQSNNKKPQTCEIDTPFLVVKLPTLLPMPDGSGGLLGNGVEAMKIINKGFKYLS